MSDQETVEKVHLIDAWVGSKEWVHAVQESILEHRSTCFGCGRPITFRLDFFYMRGAMGIIMLHDECFTPYGRGKKSTLKARDIKSSSEGELPPGEWLTLAEAANFIGISYTALYQRIWSRPGGFQSSALRAEKRNEQWFVSRESVEAMGKGKLTPGRKLDARTKGRMWRSDVTEPIDRISSAEAARRIGVSRTWVLSRREKFDAVKIDGEWRLSAKFVEDYIRDEEHG